MSELPITIDVIGCPLCDWQYGEKVVYVSPDVLAGVFGTGVMQAVARQQRQQRIEDALDAHLRTHTHLQWLQKVMDLQTEIETLRGDPVTEARSAFFGNEP